MTPYGPGGHPGDALSAYLDDELAPAARQEVDAHLQSCADCRAELDAAAAARQAIRTLPVRRPIRPLVPPVPADAPSGQEPAAAEAGPFRSGLTPRRGRVAWALAAAVAAAVALLLPQEPEVAPSLPSLADSHAARASVSGDPLTQLAPIAVPVRFGP